MPTIKLTKRTIDALPLPTDPKGVRYFDEKLTGFGIAVYPSGKKSFFINYGPDNQRRRLTLGRYGTLTLEDALKRAKAELKRIGDGGDPLEEKRRMLEIPTFGEWADSYLERVKMRKKNPREDIRYLGSVKGQWKTRRLNTIMPEDIEKAAESILADAKGNNENRTAANRFLASVRACLQEAWRKGYIESNPAMKVRPYPEGEPRSRVLNDKEFDRLLGAIETLREDPYFHPSVHAAMLMLVLTGARLSEVLNARWKDIDLDNGLWTIPTTKSGRKQIIPIPANLISLLDRLAKEGPFVVGGRHPDKPRADLQRPWDRVKERAGLKDVSIHDLRRTFGLHISRTAGLHVASKLLRHSDIRVTERHYAPLGTEALREALEARSNVIPLRGVEKGAEAHQEDGKAAK